MFKQNKRFDVDKSFEKEKCIRECKIYCISKKIRAKFCCAEKHDTPGPGFPTFRSFMNIQRTRL